MSKRKHKSSSKKLDRAFIRVYRENALREQDFKCVYCYERLNYRTVTADHIKAKSKGGNNGEDNIDAVCSPCNKAKGSMTKSQYGVMISVQPRCLPIEYTLAWIRRRLNLQILRAERNILASVGRYDKRKKHLTKSK